MNTIIMIFALPIGLYLLSQEKQRMQSYQKIFDDFFDAVKADGTRSNEEKLKLVEDMLYKNGYKIIHRDKKSVAGEKRIFSIGWMFIGIGTLYIGLIVYILYYLYFQKPHRVRFELEAKQKEG
jgi:tetrahydromethanopterin S-methyltransferase subunit F